MLDSHHYGEKFAVYYAHIKYGMKYYADIMLVHGFADVAPAWFADNILGDLSFMKERIADNIITILFCVFNLVAAFLIFRKDLILGLLSSGILIYLLHLRVNCPVYCVSFALCYLILLHFYKQNTFFWYTFFYVTSCIMLLYQTTNGTACAAASLPLFVRKFRDNPKAGILFLALAGIISYFVFGELITAYISKAGYYISSNLYAFGNDFPSKINIYRFIIAIFGFLAIPFFVNAALTSEKREIQYLSLYAVILPVVISNYALGRIDSSSSVPRAIWLSFIIITVILPYFAYITNKNRYLLKVVLCLIFISFAGLEQTPPARVFYEDLSVMNYIRSLRGETYLDLTNRGMNYYYSSKKPAIPYTSFYNIVNTKQTKEILENFKQNPPPVVLIRTAEGILGLDKVRPPQRINAVYRWLFTSGNYKKEELPFGSFLIYSPGSSLESTLLSDCYFSASDIRYLPDAWGASVNTLPMKKVRGLQVYENVIITDCTSEEADLLYIEYTAQDSDTAFSMTVNDIPSVLKFQSKKNKLLIPLDNYPSWLCADRLKFITIQADKSFNIQKAELYKRN